MESPNRIGVTLCLCRRGIRARIWRNGPHRRLRPLHEEPQHEGAHPRNGATFQRCHERWPTALARGLPHPDCLLFFRSASAPLSDVIGRRLQIHCALAPKITLGGHQSQATAPAIWKPGFQCVTVLLGKRRGSRTHSYWRREDRWRGARIGDFGRSSRPVGIEGIASDDRKDRTPANHPRLR